MTAIFLVLAITVLSFQSQTFAAATSKYFSVKAITLDKTTMTLIENGPTGILTASVSPSKATDKTVTWNTSDSNIATVTNGTVTPIAAGTALITATASNGLKSNPCTVIVNQEAVSAQTPVTPVTDVTVEETPITEVPVAETPITEAPVAAAPIPANSAYLTAFGAKCDGITDDTVALTNALKSDYDAIIIPQGTTYVKTGNILIDSGKAKILIGESGAVIKCDFDTPKFLFNFKINVECKNFTVDFNNKYMTTGISYTANVGTVKISDIVIQNVRDMDSSKGSTGINVLHSALNAERLTFQNLYKKGNGVIGEDAGNLTGLYYKASTGISGYIKDVKCVEMHNIDASGNIIFEDVSGVYVLCPVRLQVPFEISGISGINYGKRLIKTQASDLVINNITSFTDKDDTMVCVGIQDLAIPGDTEISIKNVSVTNVKVEGKCLLAFASSIDGLTLDGLTVNVTKPNMTGNQGDSAAIQFSGKNAVFSNINAKSRKGIILVQHGVASLGALPVDNVTIQNSYFETLNDGGVAFQLAGTTTGLSNIKIANCEFLLNNTSNPCFLLKNTDSNYIKNFTVQDIKITSPTGMRILTANKAQNLTIERITGIYTSTSPYNPIVCTNSSNLTFKDIILLNYVGKIPAVCSTSYCTDVVFDNITATSCDWLVSSSYDNNDLFKNLEYSKVAYTGTTNITFQ